MTKAVTEGAPEAEMLLQLWDETGKTKRGILVLRMSSASNTKLCVALCFLGSL